MARKSSDGTTCRSIRGWHSVASVIVVLGVISLYSAAAVAAEQLTGDPCENALINQEEAKEIASSYMQEQGWPSWKRFRETGMTRFRIGEAKCLNGQWHVSVIFNRRVDSLHSRQAVVLINCHSGSTEETLRSA